MHDHEQSLAEIYNRLWRHVTDPQLRSQTLSPAVRGRCDGYGMIASSSLVDRICVFKSRDLHLMASSVSFLFVDCSVVKSAFCQREPGSNVPEGV